MKLSIKQLNEEGITKEFLQTIDLSQYSPAQLRPQEEPVKLVKCGGGFWVILPDGKYLKDEKNKLMIISEKEVKIGRARYLLNFKEEIITQKIDSLVRKTQLSLEQEATQSIAQMREILIYAGHISPDRDNLEHLKYGYEETHALDSFMRDGGKTENRYDKKVKEAKALATEDFIKTHDWLKELLETKDYDSLFIMLRQKNMPLLASADKTNEAQLKAMAMMFNLTNLHTTINELEEKGHLYCYCKFTVLSEN